MVARLFDRRRTVQAANERAFAWSETGQQRAHRLHRNAPRGGVNINKYKRHRSAPGEPPAPEEGDLLRILSGQPTSIANGYEFPVNYAVLEFGYSKRGRVLEPRPLGRMVLSHLKNRVRNRRGP